MTSLTPREILLSDGLRTAADHIGGAERERVLAALRAGNIHRAHNSYRKAVDKSIAEKTAEINELNGNIARVQRVGIAYDELAPWADTPRLERAAGSFWQECFEGLSSAIELDVHRVCTRPELRRSSVAYIVEHDWAAPLSNAEQFSIGEYRLPHDHCCFEFQISGKRVCAVVSGTDGQPLTLTPLIKGNVGWALALPYYSAQGAWTPDGLLENNSDRLADVIRVIGEQIRAICIALEAEVVAAKAIRAPHKLNAARQTIGVQPIYEYHVLSLAHRKRSELPNSTDDENRRRMRMHFRRGHWRHFANHKTWIKWMLVGNPDLGFIDKHYRL